MKRKEMDQLVREAERTGWEIVRRPSGHLVFRRPGCQPVFTSSTPGDTRALLKIRKALAASASGRPVPTA